MEDGVLRKEPTEGVSLDPCFDDLMKFGGRWGKKSPEEKMADVFFEDFGS